MYSHLCLFIAAVKHIWAGSEIHPADSCRVNCPIFTIHSIRMYGLRKI